MNPVSGFRSTSVRSKTCRRSRSEEHTSELQSLAYLVCRLLLEKKKKKNNKKNTKQHDYSEIDQPKNTSLRHLDHINPHKRQPEQVSCTEDGKYESYRHTCS